MSAVTIACLSKRFEGKPPTIAADDLSLEIDDGEFLVLLGPSGCGKTTTLRCLAGLEEPDQGRIAFGGRTVFDAGTGVNLSPDKRNIGMVFQSYALWPHMTVRKNIAYPLKARRLKREVSQGWIEETAALVDCSNLLDRYPNQLSGGQQQRVAVARALVARPDLLLFDEPLSNLDARLRDQVRNQLHELHQRLGFTAVFVTHDQSEALALGDRLAIMRNGTIEQFDTAQRVFEVPATEYVAAFIGMADRLVLERGDGGWMFEGGPVTGGLDAGGHDRVAVRLRPDDLRVARCDGPLPEGSLAVDAHIVDSSYGGRHIDVIGAVGETRLHARVPNRASDGWLRALMVDDKVRFHFQVSDAMFYDLDGARITQQVRIVQRVIVGA